jgi:ubiquinone/menaquinone biosynthesis C-methylase UbiE
MRLNEAGRAEAQSFDRVAEDYDRLGELNDRDHQLGTWLQRMLPAADRRALDLGCGTGRHAVLLAERFEHVDAIDVSASMIELAQARRPGPNITYRQADLHSVDGASCYDLVTSTLTLHHVPSLHRALNHIKTLLAPGGRMILVDVYHAAPTAWPRQLLQRIVPLRPRLHALAILRLAVNLSKHGPATAWEIYRLSTRRHWLDHLVSDQFFSRDELERSCTALFPGHRLLDTPRGLALLWDAPLGSRRPPEAGLAGASLR